MKNDKDLNQVRILFSTVTIASFLGYLAVRPLFEKWLGDTFELILLSIIFASAICGLVYIYLSATELKYYNSRILPNKVSPKYKYFFFDLSVDVFLLIPVVVTYYYMQDLLTAFLPSDDSFRRQLAAVISFVLLFSAIPLIKGIVLGLKLLLYEEKKPMKILGRSKVVDRILAALLLTFVFINILPTEAESYAAIPRMIMCIIIALIFIYVIIIKPINRANVTKRKIDQ